MKVIQLGPGSGGTFYCQNCLRDYSLVRALRRQGHDVMLVPLYLPPFDQATNTAHVAPVFFGGINVYLQQRFALFQKTPRWLDRLFDSLPMLKLAAAREGATDAAQLGPMTLSMLQGRDGRQRKEFERLVAWLKQHEKPDLVHISNALLLGLAPAIKEALDVPVACSLQDEEPWLDAMPEPWRRQAWDAIRGHLASVDSLIATSNWYADRMSRRLSVPRESIQVVYLGVEPETLMPAERQASPPTLGFLSRLSESQGLGILIDAFIALRRNGANNDLRLNATGGSLASDKAFLDRVHKTLREAGLDHAVNFLLGFQQSQRRDFFNALSVFSTPMPHGEAFGVQVVEAMAAGVPVVQPAVGAYTEIIEMTGGGILYDPDRKGALEGALESVLHDRALADTLAKKGRAAVAGRFTIDRCAQGMIDTFAKLLRKGT
jgi:glycosyltransferase involved in cell wall biosynthesis